MKRPEVYAHSRFRWGHAVRWSTPWYSTAVGVVGPNWENGRWMGGGSWERYGPLCVCRHRNGPSIRYRLLDRPALFPEDHPWLAVVAVPLWKRRTDRMLARRRRQGRL